eukprot:TRINITY_DN24974_c0_g1_i1.p1 TRINITY_DN24974_c0_g1~~TRINITY_DN24974_c0_g1_i1.p1  ORF type:complete len:107 (+),score=13.09 TRINITY_DN24974_c0_g1_i1:77-397(+)
MKSMQLFSQSNRLINTLQTEFDEKVNILQKFVKTEHSTLVNKSQEIKQEIMSIKTQTDLFDKKIETIAHENQTLISTRLGSFTNEIDQRIKEVDETMVSKTFKIRE